MKDYHVVSLSGGKDSTAMLLMMLEKGMQVDEVVCCDTGLEFPEMYEHLAKVEQHTGIQITHLKADKSFEHYMYDHVRVRGEYEGLAGYGWPRPRARWCTAYLKTKVIDRYFKELRKTHNVIEYVGIAADEAWREKDKRYPLIEWGITEKQALDYCYERGFRWGGLYDSFKRVSCWCCPLQPLSELKKLRAMHPDLWQRLREMDARAWNSFRIDYTVEDLEQRFAEEDMQLSLDLDMEARA